MLARCHLERFNAVMSDHIYKKIELVGSSPNGIEDAVNNAISRAGKTIRNMKWFEVVELRGQLENNQDCPLAGYSEGWVHFGYVISQRRNRNEP